VIAEAIALGEESKPVPWARLFLGMRAWYQDDSISAVELFDTSWRYPPGEVHVMPWWGVGPLLRVVAGADTEEAFGPIELSGHHSTGRRAASRRLYRISVPAARRLNQSPKQRIRPAYAVCASFIAHDGCAGALRGWR
jgi:hypothetical protein